MINTESNKRASILFPSSKVYHPGGIVKMPFIAFLGEKGEKVEALGVAKKTVIGLPPRKEATSFKLQVEIKEDSESYVKGSSTCLRTSRRFMLE